MSKPAIFKGVKVSGIYAIRNIVNDKVYVGQSVDIWCRWLHHRRHLRKGRHSNPHLQSAWAVYGEGSFELEVLQLEEDREKLEALERAFLVSLASGDSSKGYNMRDAEGHRSLSPETKAKIGAANKGKVRTPEMRARRSAASMGRGKGRVKSLAEIENIKKAHERRRADPDGYVWFRSPKGRDHLSSAGSKGAASRWGDV